MGEAEQTPVEKTYWLPVELANTQSMILALLTAIAWFRQVHVYDEQPRSPLLHRHLGSFLFLLRILDVRQGVVGKRFGFSSVKPLGLRSTNPKLKALKPCNETKKTALITKSLVTINEFGGVTGKKSDLQESTRYLAEFATAILKIMSDTKGIPDMAF